MPIGYTSNASWTGRRRMAGDVAPGAGRGEEDPEVKRGVGGEQRGLPGTGREERLDRIVPAGIGRPMPLRAVSVPLSPIIGRTGPSIP